MRFAKRKIATTKKAGGESLNVGFVATLDCALLVAARELGLYEKQGLSVRLTREVGWATIREKLLHDELDAAGAHASMAFSIYCGISVVRRPCLTGLLLGMNGSAITLSRELWEAGVRDAATLGAYVRDNKHRRTLNLGVVLEISSQNYKLRKWLQSGGIDPDRDVRITVIPSVLVFESFREGYLDGYCVAEPWNTAAVHAGNGWVAAAVSEIEPMVPEKVLLVLQDFAERREEEHLRLIAALMEASEFCDVPENRPELARMLAQSRYFDVPAEMLTNSLVGPFHDGHTRRNISDFAIFAASKCGAPTREMGRRTFDLVSALGPKEPCPALHADVIPKVFREDVFHKSRQYLPTGGAGTAAAGGSPDFPLRPSPPASPRAATATHLPTFSESVSHKPCLTV